MTEVHEIVLRLRSADYQKPWRGSVYTLFELGVLISAGTDILATETSNLYISPPPPQQLCLLQHIHSLQLIQVSYYMSYSYVNRISSCSALII